MKKLQPYPASIEAQMQNVYHSLSEKDRRRYTAIEALKLGYGGIRPFTENNYPFFNERGWIVTNHFAIPSSRSKRCSSKSIAFCVNFLPVS
jgi:hypothetical protein